MQGNTVSSLGPHRGLQQVRRVVEDTMKNVHPIYHIKSLMIKRELARDEKLRSESWERFLPTIHTKNISKRKQPSKKKAKKEYTPFPPPQPESKVDKLLATGEYFLKEEERKQNRLHENQQKQLEAVLRRKEQRQAAFVPPEEPVAGPSSSAQTSTTDVDIQQFKDKIRKSQMKKKKTTKSKWIVTRRNIQFPFRAFLLFLKGESFLYFVLFFVTTVYTPQSISSKKELVRFGQGRYSLNDNEQEMGVSWGNSS